MKKIILMNILSVSLISCVQTGTNESQFFQEVPELGVNEKVSFQQINELIIKTYNCVQCHSDWALTEVGIQTKIIAGEPFNSPFYLRLEDGTMPMGGPQVDKQKLEYVERYIRQLD